VLDGLCFDEHDLEREDHDIATHSHKKINLIAFAMLMQRCYPRIHGLQKQRSRRLDPGPDYMIR